MDYLAVDKPALQDECRRRELPVSGTKEELVARLVESDANRQPADDVEQLLGGDNDADGGGDGAQPDQEPAAAPAAVDPPPAPAAPPTPQEATPPPPPPAPATRPAQPSSGYPRESADTNLGVFRVVYQAPAGTAVGNSLHWDYVADAVARAAASGHTVRGGLTSGRRVPSPAGTVTYEVSIRRSG